MNGFSLTEWPLTCAHLGGKTGGIADSTVSPRA
jgi:hypothetical protein